MTTETSVGQQNDGGSSSPVDTAKPGKPYGEMTGPELQEAFSNNEKARSVLTAMGLINPVFAVVGRGATNMAEKQILEAMEKNGVQAPVDRDSGGLLTNIFDTVKNFFGGDNNKDKDPVVKTNSKPTVKTPIINPTAGNGGNNNNNNSTSNAATDASQKATGNMSGKTTAEKTKISKAATKGITKGTSSSTSADNTTAGGADLDTSYGISGLKKGGLVSRPVKKKKKK